MLPDDPGVPRATSEGMMKTGAERWVSRNTTTQCSDERIQQRQVPAFASGRLQFVKHRIPSPISMLDTIYLRK